MKTVMVITGTRAEYHLLYPLIIALKKEDELNVELAVTGSHLSPRYGNTYKDIENDGVSIDFKVPILDGSNKESDINKAMSCAILGFDKIFNDHRPDLVILLGDRYELLSVAIVCMNYRIPIAHLHGGETTEGAIDECIRHSITKMSFLHFTSCEQYRRRVIQLGENPSRVYNVGAIGIENILKVKRMTLDELNNSLKAEVGEKMKMKLNNNFAVFTFHPVTLEGNVDESKISEIFEAIDSFKDLQIIFTKSNADLGGLTINKMIDDYVEKNNNRCIAVYSLGLQRYLSAISLAKVVIGNSSSGILETPSFGVPTVNIGDRQRGRIQADNIINCAHTKECIVNSINIALSSDFQEKSHKTVSPYGDGHVTEKIVPVIKKFLAQESIDLKKKFHDLKYLDR